jgi:hypothetical protein
MTKMTRPLARLSSLSAVTLLAALPATVQVPAGHKVAMKTVGMGDITDECRDKANPAMGAGAMTGASYIQRVALQGGVAPAMACTPASKGAREIVKYQADYIFWTAL